MRRMRGVGFLVLCGSFFLALVTAGRGAEQPVMRAHFINVGQADSILLEFPCGAALIDAGVQDDEREEHLISYLQTFFARRPDLDNTLSVVFITHSHIDHTMGLRAVAEAFRIRNYVDNGILDGKGKVNPQWIREVAEERRIKIYEVSDATVRQQGHKHGLSNKSIDPIACEACDPKIVVLTGGHEEYDNLNNESLVIRVDFGESSFLFSGDAEEEELDELLGYYGDTPMLAADILKVGHHGSHNATTADYLLAVKPRSAVISVGRWTFGQGSPDRFTTFAYGHPRRVALDLLSAAIGEFRNEPLDVMAANGVRSFSHYAVSNRIYATAWDGDIVVRADLNGRYRTTTERTTTPDIHPFTVTAPAAGGLKMMPVPQAATAAAPTAVAPAASCEACGPCCYMEPCPAVWCRGHRWWWRSRN